jgi:hypothetical protein
MLKWVIVYIVDVVGTWVTLDMVTFNQQTFVFGQEIHILNLDCVGIKEFTPPAQKLLTKKLLDPQAVEKFSTFFKGQSSLITFYVWVF